MPKLSLSIAAALSSLVLLSLPSCTRSDPDAGEAIDIKGSDTMVQLATAWAEEYTLIAPDVKLNASGGGSGTGIAALINGTATVCTSSRDIKDEERERIVANTGEDVTETVIGLDALALYTNPKNPVKEIAMSTLTKMWAENGKIENWKQIDPSFSGRIVLIGRQNNSGTYDYFREHIGGQTPEGKWRELRGGISELNGSSEVVEQIAKIPTAIGYSGMGYKTDAVNWLAISREEGESAAVPSIEGALSGNYPIARKLYLYTIGEPYGNVKDFIDWVLSPAGQKIVANEGFVPIN